MASVNIEVGMTGASKFQTDVTNSGDALAYLKDVADGAASSLDTFNEALDTVTKDQERQKNLTALAESTADIAEGIQTQVDAAVKVANAFFGAAEATANYGDEIDKESQKLGISRQAYQEWSYVLGQSGASINSMKSSMQQLAKVQEGLTKTASEDLESLGLSLEGVQDMSREELFAAVITGLQGMEESSERAMLAQRLLGSSYKELTPLMNTSAEDTAALVSRFYDLGGYMSDEAIDAASAYGDSVDDINLRLEAFKRNVFSQFLPALTELRNNIIDNGSLDRLADDIASLATNGVSLLTWLVDHSDAAVTAVEAIGAAWLTWKGVTVVGELVKNMEQLYGWVTLLGDFLGIGAGAAAGGVAVAGLGVAAIVDEAATLENIGYLGKGHELQEYADNVTLYAQAIEDWHQRNDEYLQSGYTEGLEMLQTELSHYQVALQHAQEEYDAMAESAGAIGSNASVWGEDMMISFANGIVSGGNNWVLPAIDDIAAAIDARLGFSEPEVGPLSDFHTWAPDMMRLFAGGIRNNIPLLNDAVTEAFDFRGLVEGGARGATTNYGGITLNVYSQGEVNADVLYREFTYRLQHDVTAREAVFAH